MSARLTPPLRGVAALLLKALARLVAGPAGESALSPILVVEAASSQPWSSATFDGELHRLTLRILGDAWEAGDALDRLVGELAEYEFDLPGRIVAEARLTAVRVDRDPSAGSIGVAIEILTIDD